MMNRLARWLRWRGIVLLAALTPPCRQIVQLASRSHEQPLSAWTRLRLSVHLRICSACERYLRQLEALHQAAGKLSDIPPMTIDARLAADAKERLRQRLCCEKAGSLEGLGTAKPTQGAGN